MSGVKLVAAELRARYNPRVQVIGIFWRSFRGVMFKSADGRPFDALSLANHLDDVWHDQPRSFEREAVTRFWGLLTLPARALDPERPRAMLRSATIIRNARFMGEAVKQMFFGNQDFTEVDALFLSVGSSVGHVRGDEGWVVEVERKTANQQGDYYRAIQRAREFASLLAGRLSLNVRPVVIFEDDAGKYSYKNFDGEVLLISMSALRDSTAGLRFPSLSDLPGVACDKTLVKLALMRALIASDPHHPGWYSGALGLARAIESGGVDLCLPVMGHQDTASLPSSVAAWRSKAKQTETHMSERIERYLDDLGRIGLLERKAGIPRLTLDGSNVVLALLRAEAEEAR